MAYKNDSYRPSGKNKIILDRAWYHVRSIPYRATMRWCFYRLLHDSLYGGKEDYHTFITLTSRARHNFYADWRPDTFVDDTTEFLVGSEGWRNESEWLASLYKNGVSCNIDHWYSQKQYVEVWYEARAMTRQFRYYADGITLRPFGGDAKIEAKYRIATDLNEIHQRYALPITVLYFGDYDKKGLAIPETAVRDIRGWCQVPFEFIRCGLNAGDELRYNIPENIEHPGAYQWEGLTDDAARQIITSAIEPYRDWNIYWSTKLAERDAESRMLSYLSEFGTSVP